MEYFLTLIKWQLKEALLASNKVAIMFAVLSSLSIILNAMTHLDDTGFYTGHGGHFGLRIFNSQYLLDIFNEWPLIPFFHVVAKFLFINTFKYLPKSALISSIANKTFWSEEIKIRHFVLIATKNIQISNVS